MNTAKKSRERYLLDRFLHTAKMKPRSVTEREAPDFVLDFESGSVGLEMTELHLESTTMGSLPLRALESVTDRIVAAAQKLFEAKHNRYAFVSVSFFESQISNRSRRDDIATALADLVASLVIEPEGLVHWRNDYSNSALDSVAFLSTHFTTRTLHGRWVVARAGWVAPLTAPIIQAAIDRKNDRYAGYTAQIPETWLLLALDGGRPSQLFEIDSQVDLSQLESKFNRTYLFRTLPTLLRCHVRSAA